MAPTAPKKRTTMRAKAARATTTSSSSTIARPQRAVEDGTDSLLVDTKRDRRHIKRSSFLSQITTKHSSGGKIAKRRRPSKKLAANLDSLADALPDLAEMEDRAEPGKVRLKSIRSRPGALKRKEKLVKAEAKNIGLSMAYLNKLKEGDGGVAGRDSQDEAMGGAREQDGATASTSTGSRWAALRAHISGTMEQNPAFLQKK